MDGVQDIGAQKMCASSVYHASEVGEVVKEQQVRVLQSVASNHGCMRVSRHI